MFEFIRTHQRLMQLLLLLLIIPSFVLVGNGVTDFSEPDTSVAKVGKQSISQQEWDNAQREQINQYRQRIGEQFDPKIFETPEAKQRVLNNIITERVMAAAVENKRLSVSDESIRQQLMAIPALIGPDGKFNNEQYKSLLAAQGMTPVIYEARLRRDLALQQLNQAIQGSAFAPKNLSSRISEINEQEREVQELLIKSADFKDKVTITEPMLKAYYDKNSKAYELPDQMKIEYVVLSNEMVATQVSIPDAQVKEAYDRDAKTRYGQPEQRRASHILLNLKKDASSAEKDQVKAKAEALLAQARKTPADFAKLAKENSQDSGSAERGGDLEFFGPGAMVKGFDEAVFKLKTGEISDLVLTEFGYHIIQLTDLKPESIKPFDDVKGEILAELKRPLVSKKMSELLTQFTETVEDRFDTLQPAADKLKLKIETASGITRQPNPSVAPDVPYNNVKFLSALFADEVIKDKRNTQAIEVSPGVLVAGRALEYKPVSLRPFEEVKGPISELLTRLESEKLASAAGTAKLLALKTTPNSAGFSEVKRVSYAKGGPVSNEAVPLLMKTDISKLPVFAGLEIPGVGYGVYRINKVEQVPNPDAKKRESQQQQIANMLGGQEMQAYLELLKEKAKVKILKPIVADASVPESKK